MRSGMMSENVIPTPRSCLPGRESPRFPRKRGVLAGSVADPGGTRLPGAYRSLKRARLPGPEEVEAFAMPADHCCRLDDRQGVAPIRPEAGDQDPEPAIGWMQSWSGRLPVQHSQLLAYSWGQKTPTY